MGDGDHDSLDGGDGEDRLFGNVGDDSLVGGNGNDTLDGGIGSDYLYVASDNTITLTDTQVTGAGTDTITNIELASLVGRDNNSLINAETATDISVLINANGGDGNDILNGGAGFDRVEDNADVNLILTDSQLTGGRGTDTLSSIEAARLGGGAGNNLLHAGLVNNMNVTLLGAEGNDSLYGGAQADVLYGQMGNDRLESRGGDDTLIGNFGDDGLYAGDGDDSLNGGNGNDVLKGEGGNDTLIGGAGNDLLILESASGTDVIRDFTAGVDRFGLRLALEFSDLAISDNSAGTGSLIRDTTNSNQLLAVVDGVSADLLSATDFVAV